MAPVKLKQHLVPQVGHLNRTLPVFYIITFKPRSLQLPTIVSRGRDGGSLEDSSTDKKNIQLLTVDHSARGSMKTAASCVSVCESQEYQIHRQVERTLRRRHSHVLPPLLHEGRISIHIHRRCRGLSGLAGVPGECSQ